jgi:6-phosphogluconolactonase
MKVQHKMKSLFSLVYAGVFLLLLSSLSAALGQNGDSSDDGNNSQNKPAGAVYTMSNAATGNEVLAFARASNGTLSSPVAYATGGRGTGGGLGNQGGLILSPNNRWLFAVNAGSHDLSVFEVNSASLKLVHRAPSGGMRPISLTLFGNYLYVLNAGGNVGARDNISGFTVDRNGNLSPIPGSTRPLSGNVTDPAQIQFSPDGDLLVVTEKATNIIDTYIFNRCGTASLPIPHPSSGATPFGFAFSKREHHIFVSEAAGGAPNASSLSSYALSDDGSLQIISPSVGDTQTAACWVVITDDQRFAFVSNTGSATLSSYQVNRNGSISLLNAVAANTGAGPVDMALAQNSRFFYVLNGAGGTIGGYRVGADGSLLALPGSVSVPTSANGLAAR